jgi:hypothetical protein
LARRSSVRSSDVTEPKIAARAPDLRRRRRRRSSAATSDESLVPEKTGYGTYAIIGYGPQFLLLPSAATAVLPGPCRASEEGDDMTMRSLCVVATAAAATSTPAASISLRPVSIPPPPRRILAVAAEAHRSRGLRCHNVSSRKQLYIARGTAKIVMGIRAVESYDASFQLQAESDQLLRSLLSSDSFCKQVAKESGLVDAGATTEFSGLLFQPVPWSPTTKHGMPQVCALFFFTFTCNSMDFFHSLLPVCFSLRYYQSLNALLEKIGTPK